MCLKIAGRKSKQYSRWSDCSSWSSLIRVCTDQGLHCFSTNIKARGALWYYASTWKT